MALYDPGDCVYTPNTINGSNRQILGDVIIQMPLAGAIGSTLTTVRKFGPGPDGIYNKYRRRNHTDAFPVRTTTTS